MNRHFVTEVVQELDIELDFPMLQARLLRLTEGERVDLEALIGAVPAGRASPNGPVC